MRHRARMKLNTIELKREITLHFNEDTVLLINSALNQILQALRLREKK